MNLKIPINIFIYTLSIRAALIKLAMSSLTLLKNETQLKSSLSMLRFGFKESKYFLDTYSQHVFIIFCFHDSPLSA